jgi:hypothetical protein
VGKQNDQDQQDSTDQLLVGWLQLLAGLVAGFVIGVLASLLGVAGGEFLIPTFVLLFGADLKLAGSLSLAVSLPTILVGFTRYSRDQSFSVLRDNGQRDIPVVMAAGSILGHVRRWAAARAGSEVHLAAASFGNSFNLSGENLAAPMTWFVQRSSAMLRPPIPTGHVKRESDSGTLHIHAGSRALSLF